MRKIISFMHISLDGFVAGLNGEMDWIKVDEEIFDRVAAKINSADTALYGRVTFEMMESYWPTAGDSPTASKHDIEHSKWYANVHKIVLSKTLNVADFTNTNVIGDNLSAQVQEIKQSEGGVILIFGSPSATHSLMKLGLVDGYWLFVNPVILGQGIPLFKEAAQTSLKLTDTRQFGCGVVELEYFAEKQPQ